MINQSRVTCLSGLNTYEKRLDEKALRRFIVKHLQVDEPMKQKALFITCKKTLK